MTRSASVGPVRLADGLGAASAALGAPMVLAPRRLLQAAGIHSDGNAKAVLTAVGVREFAATATILGMRHRRVGAWSRVVGDTMDLTLLGVAFRTRRDDTPRLIGAIALIATIFATDLFTALKLNQAEGVGVPDGSTSHGAGASHETGGGPARVRSAVTVLASEEEMRAAFHEFPWSEFDARSLEASGRARFVRAPGGRGTELHLDYDPPVTGGRTAIIGLKLAGRSPDQKINDQLRQFKALIETGVQVRSDKTPESFSSGRQIFQRAGQPPTRQPDDASEQQPGRPMAGRS